jgi:4-hydroxybenzoyl-CoA thioesterase
MKRFRHTFIVDFADCDPARIVYYPRYFEWFDRSTERMFRDSNLDWPTMWDRYNLSGIPLIDASANFKGPSRFGDTIEVESRISNWRDKVFVVAHVMRNAGVVVVEGREVRVWAQRAPDRPRGMKAVSIPPEIRAAFAQ